MDILEADLAMAEIFHNAKEKGTGMVVRMVCHLEIFHKETYEVITMVILVRMEDLPMAKGF